MDALRGGFGTIGSILRVRSARRVSNASTLTVPRLPRNSVLKQHDGFGSGSGGSTLNHGMESMPRYSRESPSLTSNVFEKKKKTRMDKELMLS